MMSRKEAWLYLAEALSTRGYLLGAGLCHEVTRMYDVGFIDMPTRDQMWNDIDRYITRTFGDNRLYISAEGNLQPRIEAAWSIYNSLPEEDDGN